MSETQKDVEQTARSLRVVEVADEEEVAASDWLSESWGAEAEDVSNGHDAY